jgi:hypothetical protein
VPSATLRLDVHALLPDTDAERIRYIAESARIVQTDKEKGEKKQSGVGEDKSGGRFGCEAAGERELAFTE